MLIDESHHFLSFHLFPVKKKEISLFSFVFTFLEETNSHIILGIEKFRFNIPTDSSVFQQKKRKKIYILRS